MGHPELWESHSWVVGRSRRDCDRPGQGGRSLQPLLWANYVLQIHGKRQTWSYLALNNMIMEMENLLIKLFKVGTAQGNVLSCRMQAKPGTSGFLLLLNLFSFLFSPLQAFVQDWFSESLNLATTAGWLLWIEIRSIQRTSSQLATTQLRSGATTNQPHHH